MPVLSTTPVGVLLRRSFRHTTWMLAQDLGKEKE